MGTPKAALGLSRMLLRVFVVLNVVTGAILLSSFIASFVFGSALANFLQRREIDADILIPTLRVWMLLGAAMVAAVHVQFSRLLEMVRTVRLGDPFVPENAARLRTIAWCLLLIQLLHLSFGVMVKIAGAANAHMDWSFSITGWFAVVLLFVLARVFEEGARIRADLEAMI